jgi:hypothetical protein
MGEDGVSTAIGYNLAQLVTLKLEWERRSHGAVQVKALRSITLSHFIPASY